MLDNTPDAHNSINLKESDLNQSKGELPLFLSRKIMNTSYPSLFNFFSNNILATLLASTRLVGMYCPGLNSVFYGISLKKNVSHKVESFNYSFFKI